MLGYIGYRGVTAFRLLPSLARTEGMQDTEQRLEQPDEERQDKAPGRKEQEEAEGTDSALQHLSRAVSSSLNRLDKRRWTRIGRNAAAKRFPLVNYILLIP